MSTIRLASMTRIAVNTVYVALSNKIFFTSLVTRFLWNFDIKPKTFFVYLQQNLLIGNDTACELKNYETQQVKIVLNPVITFSKFCELSNGL